jgi:hypothetical protein
MKTPLLTPTISKKEKVTETAIKVSLKPDLKRKLSLMNNQIMMFKAKSTGSMSSEGYCISSCS